MRETLAAPARAAATLRHITTPVELPRNLIEELLDRALGFELGAPDLQRRDGRLLATLF